MQVERTFLHTTFELEPVLDDGRPHIRLTTREPVTEPFLNFVLNVRWPQGRFAREYTLLLDLPRPGTETELRRVSYDARPAFTPAAADSGAAGSDAIRTRRGDTLWELAQRLRQPGMSLARAMDAIVAANPHAFVGGDPDRLKAGVRVALPAEPREAIARRDMAVPVSVPAATSGAADAELQQSLAQLEQGVGALHGELAGTRDRLQRMEAQLSQVIAGYQRLAGTGPLPVGTMPTPREDVLADLRSLDVSNLPVSPVIATAEAQTAAVPERRSNWWLHGSYLALALGTGLWLLRSRLRPTSRPAVVAAPSEREILDELAASQPVVPTAAASPPLPPVTRSFADTPVEPEELIDPLLEAGAYIAFAQYDRAEAVLNKAVDEQPQRGELKLQLLDLYKRSGQAEKLARLAEELAASADGELAAQARQYH